MPILALGPAKRGPNGLYPVVAGPACSTGRAGSASSSIPKKPVTGIPGLSIVTGQKMKSDSFMLCTPIRKKAPPV